MSLPASVLRFLRALLCVCASFEVTASADVPTTLAAVLDEPALTWSAGGDGPWVAVDSPLFPAGSGEYGIGWAALPERGTAWVETEITGPGLLEFRWAGTGVDTTSFTADGVPLGSGDDGPALGTASFQVPSGMHHVRWSVSTLYAQAITSGCLLDRVKWTPNGVSAWTGSMSANGASIPGWFISYRANSMPTTDVAKVDGPGSSLRFNDIEGLSMALLCTEATRISFSVIANQKLYFDEAVESSNLDSSVQRMEWVQRSFPDQATGWRHHATVVGGGVHAVRWVFEVDDDDGAMNLWLDQFKLEIPNASDVLGVSRNQPWAFSNDSWGLAPACYASERDEFIGSVKLHLDGSEWLETNVIGPARVAMKSKWLGSGQVRVGVELGGTTLGTTTATVVDQNNYGQATALSPWVVTTAEIPAGPQVVRWRYTSPVETAGSGGWLLVDDFILTKLGLQDLAEALDIPTQPLETDQRSVWSVTADEAQVGSTRVLGQLRGMPHAALSLPLTGPCLVSFQWQSSSYHLDVSLRTPRSRSYAITPSIGSYWGTVEEFIPPGQSVLQWVLATGTSVPEDTFGLDGVRITNDPVSLNEALDDPTGHYTAAVSGVYPMASGLRADDDDAVFLDNGSATSGWVQRTVEGPAVVHWKAPYGSSVSLDGIAMFNGGELIVPSGTHEVRWSAFTNSYSRLEGVQVVNAISLGAALEDPTPGWTSSAEVMALDFHDPTVQGPSSYDETRVLIGAASPGVQGWVQKEFTGPALVEWLVVWDRYGNLTPSLTFTLDGVVERTTHDPQRNYMMIVNIPPGPHVARWISNAGAQVALDHVRWQASPLRPWSEILGPPTGTLRSGGNKHWVQGGAFGAYNDVSGSYDVIDLVTHPALVSGEQMWLEWEMEGPGVASFNEYNKEAPTQTPNAKAKTVWLDGGPLVVEKASAPSYRIEIPAGSHRIRWVVDGPVSGAGFLQLAELGWQPQVANSFGAALETPNGSWFNSGLGWTNAPAAPPGVGEAVVPPISYAGSYLGAEFIGPAVLEYRIGGDGVSTPGSYYAGVFVEQLSDYSIPLLPVDSSSGTSWLWQTNRMELPPGRCMVAFPSRSADANFSLMLDHVTLAALPRLPIAESLQMAPSRLQQGGVVPWVGYQKASGKCWVAPSDGLPPGEQCWLAMTLTGPVRFELPAYRSFSYAADLSVLVDGDVVKTFPSPSLSGYSLFTWTVGAGEHELRLLVKRRFEGIEGPRPTVELEVPRIIPLPFPSQLPGWNSFQLTTDPRAPWVVDPATVGTGPNGNGAVFTNAIGTATASAALSVTGPKWIVLDWDKAGVPNIDLDGRSLVVAQYETMRTTLPVIRSGIFIPAGKHQLSWHGIGPLAFISVTDPPPSPDLLPGDPITIGRPGEAAFIENTSTGWTVDAASFVEGTSAWSAPRFVGAWMGFRGPGTLTYAMRNTGNQNGNLRLRIDAEASTVTTGNTWTSNFISIPAGWHVVQFQSYPLITYTSWLDDVRFTPTDAFGKWCQAHALPMTDWFIDRDANADGIPNGVEYALGQDPWTNKRVPGGAEISPTGLPQVRFPKPDPAATGVTTQIQVSSDLQHWSEAASVGLTLLDEGASLVLPMAAPWTYARMKVMGL